jgi:hypothetical protein
VLSFSYMEPQVNETESIIAPLKKVTPLSKYLALGLFIVLPFLGGYVGYTFAPEKVVEVERVVETENEVEVESAQDSVTAGHESSLTESITYTDNKYNFSLQYPAKYGVLQPKYYPGNKADSESLLHLMSEDGQKVVTSLYGSKYDSGTDTIKTAVCTNKELAFLHSSCIKKVNKVGTDYFEVNLDSMAGNVKRFEFYVSEDFSLILFDRGEEVGQDVDLINMIKDSFQLI